MTEVYGASEDFHAIVTGTEDFHIVDFGTMAHPTQGESIYFVAVTDVGSSVAY